MRVLLIILSISLAVYSGAKAQNPSQEVPCEKGINLIPMYGEVQKCPKQIESYDDFLTICDQQFQSRKEASTYHIDTPGGDISMKVT